MKVSINKDLARLSAEKFEKWFKARQEKGKFPKEEKWEDHYKILKPEQKKSSKK